MNQLQINFHNTTDLKGRELRQAIASAIRQNDKILTWFKAHPFVSFSPSEVHREIFDETTPITSVRRSITNLTNEGWLEKTTRQVIGNYNAKEFCWRLK